MIKTNLKSIQKIFSLGLCVLFSHSIADFPENASDWQDKGTVFVKKGATAWEKKAGTEVVGVDKVNGKYFLFYTSGRDGCWKQHAALNHVSLGVATSDDGLNFKRYEGNPILKPHDFVPVSSMEEGIRMATVKWVAEKNMFYGFFGVEDPVGPDNCPFGGNKNCKCNIQVHSHIQLATSKNGFDWDVKGPVDGANNDVNGGTIENYANTFVYDGKNFILWHNHQDHKIGTGVSIGSDPLKLKDLGTSTPHTFWRPIGGSYLRENKKGIILIHREQKVGGAVHLYDIDLNGDIKKAKNKRLFQKKAMQ